jgi:hypothetical protein
MCFDEPSTEGFAVRDEGRNTVACVAAEADARQIVATLNLVGGLLEQFPGLAGDREEGGALVERAVDGADLVDFINERLAVEEGGRFREPDADGPDAVVGGEAGPATPPDEPPDAAGAGRPAPGASGRRSPAGQVQDNLPKVDFTKEIVVLGTTNGTRIRMWAKLDDQGNLQVLGNATTDYTPGFRYVIATVPREGVKTVDGKELPKE